MLKMVILTRKSADSIQELACKMFSKNIQDFKTVDCCPPKIPKIWDFDFRKTKVMFLGAVNRFAD